VSEQSRPKPFPEARPPHLPDVLTRQSPWILFFIAVAVLQVWRSLQMLPPPQGGLDAGQAINSVLSWIPTLAPTAFALALFWRHPDARRTMPLLVFGLVLIAVGELLTVFAEPIRALLRNITPTSDPAQFVLETPAEFAFRVFTLLLAIFALLYVGAGLSSARARERGPVERPLAIWLVALGVVSTVLSLAGLATIGVEVTPLLVIQLVVGVILSGLETLAWAYVAVVAIGGWISGDSPRRAWGLAAIGASALYGLRLIVPVLGFIPFDPAAVPVYLIFAYVSYAGWLLLAAAFVLGLPTPASAGAAAETEATGDPPVATQPGSATG
jgi:hypothetical protein